MMLQRLKSPEYDTVYVIIEGTLIKSGSTPWRLTRILSPITFNLFAIFCRISRLNDREQFRILWKLSKAV